MQTILNILLAQVNFLVGDIEGNAEKIINVIQIAKERYQPDVVVFPELTISGYPPEDLLFRPELYERIAKVLPVIQANCKNIDVILGYPEKIANSCFNKAVMIRDGSIVANYCKQALPNYSVFDELRYFKSGKQPCIVNIKGIPTAITICEDLWHPEPMAQAALAGAKLMISLNASPFDRHKSALREQILSTRARQGKMPVVYVNWVGGQDELVFDGGSMVVDEDGVTCQQADFFKDCLFPIQINIANDKTLTVEKGYKPKPTNEEESIYQALVLGVRDYIEKNNFTSAILGLSGGIDSALTLAIAVDAIGKERVHTLLMPSRYTADMSIADAKQEADILGVSSSVISIEPIFKTFLESLKEEFTGFYSDTAEENLQSRCRGTLLMAISNKKNAIVLTTGNKSEMAVGYATLYGDMAGGFCVLKDIPKTLVYRLANYRNQVSPVIPLRVIERPPSAELAPNQKDEDSLLAYPILDAILERYIEQDQSINDIVSAGFNELDVRRVVRMIDRNEYKRRQAPPGVRITERAFGKDRRYPITSGFLRFLFSNN